MPVNHDLVEALKLVETAALAVARRRLRLEALEVKIAALHEERDQVDEEYHEVGLELARAKEHLRLAVRTAVEIKARE